jgi:S-formylglutathione hydrolase FrmB
MPYRLIMPDVLATSHEKYPVLYLLHGLFGSCDNWLELTGIAEYAAERNMAIVMPEGGDGWYTDSATLEDDRFESYFTSELMPEIEGRFPLGGSRDKRGISGISMGGYGAFKFALKHPEQFCFAASMSGAFEAPLRTDGAVGFVWEILGPSVNRAFGGENSEARLTGDIFALAEDLPDDGDRQPYFYLDCGSEDGFAAINRRFANLLKLAQIDYEYHEGPGGHDWNYWDSRLNTVLGVFEEKISSPNGKNRQKRAVNW